ncbi:MAG TPA: hypothetical protein VMU54_18495, partial [Planctomycetota bacterium]|nr:hypothetical protein [Planctomycetota bacterium]
QPKEWAALFETLRLGDITEDFQPLSSATWNLPGNNPVGRTIWSTIWSHLDATGPDLRWVITHLNQNQIDDRRKYAGILMDLSPRDPAAVVELIHHDWPKMEPRAAELERTLGHHPTVLQALGRRYSELQNVASAERCFHREIEIAPNADASLALAKLYLDQGEEDKWKATMEAALKGEEYGLEHVRIRVELARYYMKTGRFDQAEPYAAAAAESWAYWAMECARECYEKLADWKKAELWQRRASERYEDRQMEWFFWCKQNEKGDPEAAAALAERYIAQLGPRATSADLEKFGIFFALTGRTRESLAAFRKSSESTNDPYAGLHAALAAMALKDGEARDAALGRILEKGPAFQAAKGRKGLEVELAKEFRNILDQGAGALPAPGVFDRLLQDADAPNSTNASYFIGRFLELQRSSAEARPYYENGLKSGVDNWNHLLLRDALKHKP